MTDYTNLSLSELQAELDIAQGTLDTYGGDTRKSAEFMKALENKNKILSELRQIEKESD